MATDFSATGSQFTSKKTDVPGLTSLGRGFQSATPGTCAGVEERVAKYTGHYDGEAEADSQTKQRSENAAEISTSYYNLVTDFFEYGYGQSFHFAPVMDELTFDECLAEYERGIAKTLGIGAGGKILVCQGRVQFDCACMVKNNIGLNTVECCNPTMQPLFNYFAL